MVWTVYRLFIAVYRRFQEGLQKGMAYKKFI